MATGFIIGIISVLVAFVAIIGLFDVFRSAAEDEEWKLDSCYAFIGAKKIEQGAIGDGFNKVKVTCQSAHFTIDDDTYDTKYKASKYFASRMGRLWKVIHAGTVEGIWDDKGFWGNAFQLTSDRQCAILTTVTYEGSDDITITREEFNQFLLEEPYVEFQGREQSYSDYIQFYGPFIDPGTKTGGYAVLSNISSGETYAIGVSSVDGIDKFTDYINSALGENFDTMLFFGTREEMLDAGCVESTPEDT